MGHSNLLSVSFSYSTVCPIQLLLAAGLLFGQCWINFSLCDLNTWWLACTTQQHKTGKNSSAFRCAAIPSSWSKDMSEYLCLTLCLALIGLLQLLQCLCKVLCDRMWPVHLKKRGRDILYTHNDDMERWFYRRHTISLQRSYIELHCVIAALQ